MGRFLAVILISIGVLTLINISLLTYIPSNPYIYLLVFILNILTMLVLSQFYSSKEKRLKNENKRDISEKSVEIFIRIFVYFSPVVALFGLYIISLMDKTKKIGIDDANDWVSFILGIASFVMALVSMWQSEGTYNRIFDGLDRLSRTTEDIKKNTDIMEALKTNSLDIGLKHTNNKDNKIAEKENIIKEQPPMPEQDSIKDLIKSQPFKIRK